MTMPQTRRAPFIWTPRQPIDPTGHLTALLGARRRDELPNRWFLFRRTLEIDATIISSDISITVDGRYLLYVNGAEIGRGPVRCSPLFQRYDSYDIGPYLRPGYNVIAVLIHTYGIDTAFYEGTKGLWRPVFGEGGLWVQGSITTAMGTQNLDSDTHWRCTQSYAWQQDVPRINHGLGFIECLDGNALPTNWTDAEFDDEGWDNAQELVAGGGGPEAFFGGLTVLPFPTLLPRAIPMMENYLVAAQRLIWTKGQVSNPSLPLIKRLYEEDLVDLPEGAISDQAGLLLAGHSDVTITTFGTTSETTDVAILLDFGKIITGRPRISLEAKGGEMIEIACSEYLPGEWDKVGADPDARIARRPVLGLDAHLCRYIARPGEQVFERFEWCAIRWMHVVIRDAPQGLKITGLGATTENYPVEARGSFSCSDPFLNQLWEVGAYTLRQCMQDAWIDCPSREQRQWLGDASVESLVGWAAFGPCITPLNAKFLIQAAQSQRPDGLTQMYAPGDHHTDGLLIPDWTLQWILNATEHYRQTADLETIEEIMPAIQKALAWFERLTDETGLLADMPYWHFMDWAGVGRHGYAATLNAQLAGSYDGAADLCDALGMTRAAGKYRVASAKIATALHELHWDARRGIYVDCVDPVTKVQELRVSQHGNAAIALWANMPSTRVQTALDRITDEARLTFTAAPPITPTGATLDPEEGVVLANTFYSHFVYEALAKHGRLGQAIELMRARFGPMLARGATTLWESFDPTASLCHAFSASPTWQLSRHVLGVYPLAPGYKIIGICPDLAGLDHAKGVFPTPMGDVRVSLSRTADGFSAVIDGPRNTEFKVSSPKGFAMTSYTGRPDLGGVVNVTFAAISYA
jgi:alpha-L-rhamnosidase